MLHVITAIDDPLTRLVKDDPVRPEIPVAERIGANKEILVEMINEVPAAVVCICYQNTVPDTVDSLIAADSDPLIAVFYTIWSYKPGAGRRLIFSARERITMHRQTVKRFVTLSPPTDLARKFHLHNGAIELRQNEHTVNYEYL